LNSVTGIINLVCCTRKEVWFACILFQIFCEESCSGWGCFSFILLSSLFQHYIKLPIMWGS